MVHSHAIDRSSHRMDLTTGLLERSPDMAAGFPQSKWSKREQRRNCQDFYDLASEVRLHDFYSILLITSASPIQTCEYQEVGISVGHLGGWLPPRVEAEIGSVCSENQWVGSRLEHLLTSHYTQHQTVLSSQSPAMQYWRILIAQARLKTWGTASPYPLLNSRANC